MSDALERIKAQVATRTAAAVPAAPQGAPVQPAAEPVSHPDAPDPAIADLQAAVVDLGERIGALEQAAAEDAMADLGDWQDPEAMVAAAAPAATTSE